MFHLKNMSSSLVAGIGFAALLYGASPASAQVLGAAQSFAIVGGQGVNANGAVSTVNGDVGINPAAASLIVGFPTPATIVLPFQNHGNDSIAISASGAANFLYNSAAMAPAGATDTGNNDLTLGGPGGNGTYGPGSWTNATEGGVALIPITKSITLTTPGLYVFSVANALTANGNVIVNGDPCTYQVFWRVPTTATLNGIFIGTVVSNGLIALGPGATMVGRALTTNTGSVTLAGGNTIGGCINALTPIPTPTPPPGVATPTPPPGVATPTPPPGVATPTPPPGVATPTPTPTPRAAGIPTLSGGGLMTLMVLIALVGLGSIYGLRKM
jgi:hypothetical protein